MDLGRIIFSGCAGCGKSSLARKISMISGRPLIDNVERGVIRKRGKPLDVLRRESPFELQADILMEQWLEETKNPGAIQANCMLDVLAWSSVSGVCHKIRDDQRDHIISYRKSLILMLNNPTDMEMDGVRPETDGSARTRELWLSAYLDHVAYFDLPEPIFLAFSDFEARVNMVLKFMNEWKP